MDANEALKKARAALATMRSDETSVDAPRDLADAFEALDLWMRTGGYPPSDWDKRPRNDRWNLED